MPGKLSDLIWGPLFARGYDFFVKGTEEAGLRDRRSELLARASGRTLELGAGTGANLELYPEAVTELVLTEPDGHMRAQLEHKLVALDRDPQVVEAGAERLPFPDSSFDTVVATLVLCTIPAPRAALAEVSRVLKPDGRLLFLEHVRAEDAGTARWQDRLERPWGWFGRGCHPNRDTVAIIGDSALEIAEVERDQMPKAPPIVRPLATGEARPSTPASA
jgi:SAM-dependent methyltransferase